MSLLLVHSLFTSVQSIFHTFFSKYQHWHPLVVTLLPGKKLSCLLLSERSHLVYKMKFHTLVTYKTWLPMTADSYQNSNPYQKRRDSLLLRTVKRMCSWLVEWYLNKWLTSRAVDSLGKLSVRSLHSEFEKKRKSHSLYRHTLYFTTHKKSKPFPG